MANRVLITGANGFLGTQIARQLIHQPGIKIIAMVRAQNQISTVRRLKRAWYDWDELSILKRFKNGEFKLI
ncbi:MAG: SDR family oxidoreductase [Methanobacteriaceae archaeon]|nr:SDR family oxidoreductase [Methanobacteriaceae archaeon]